MDRKRVEELLCLSKKKERLAHAYMVQGGSQKTRKEVGVFFSQLLVCETDDKKTISPCKKCSACLLVKKESHPDVQWVTPEKSILSIDEVRRLKEEIYIKPFSAQYKVFLLEADWMKQEAANSLLKILEEPPPYGVLVLLVRTAHNFLPTIVSRCIRLSLNLELDKEVEQKNAQIIKCILDARRKRNWNEFFNRINAFVKDTEREEQESLVEQVVLLAHASFIQNEAKSAGAGRPQLPERKQTDIMDIKLDTMERILQFRNRLRYNVNPRVLLERLFLEFR